VYFENVRILFIAIFQGKLADSKPSTSKSPTSKSPTSKSLTSKTLNLKTPTGEKVVKKPFCSRKKDPNRKDSDTGDQVIVMPLASKRKRRRRNSGREPMVKKTAISTEPNVLQELLHSVNAEDMKMVDDDFIVVVNKDSSDEEEEDKNLPPPTATVLGTVVTKPEGPLPGFTCELCHSDFDEFWLLEVHCATVHVGRVHKCTLCTFYTVNEAKLSEHLALWHGPSGSQKSAKKVKERTKTPNGTGAKNGLVANSLNVAKNEIQRSVKTKQNREVRANDLVTCVKLTDFVIGDVRSIDTVDTADLAGTRRKDSDASKIKGTKVKKRLGRPPSLGSVRNGPFSMKSKRSITLEDEELGTVTVNKVDADDDEDDEEDEEDWGSASTPKRKGTPGKPRPSPRTWSKFLCPECPEREPFRYRKSYDNHLRQHGLEPSIPQPEVVETPVQIPVDILVSPPRRPQSSPEVASVKIDSPGSYMQMDLLSPKSASKQMFACPKCPERAPFKYQKSFEKHMLEHKPVTPQKTVKGDFYCPDCPNRAPFHYRKSYDNHLKAHILEDIRKTHVVAEEEEEDEVTGVS